MVFAVLLSLLAPVSLHAATSSEPVASEAPQEVPVFDKTAMEKLGFLEGRWMGLGPDGAPFYEIYDRPDAATLRSRRFEDASFARSTDGSMVVLEDGVITSRWGEYSWRASAIADGFAAFEPVNAPSAFSWRRIDSDRVEVTQQWTDDRGQAQSYTLLLQRVP